MKQFKTFFSLIMKINYTIKRTRNPYSCIGENLYYNIKKLIYKLLITIIQGIIMIKNWQLIFSYLYIVHNIHARNMKILTRFLILVYNRPIHISIYMQYLMHNIATKSPPPQKKSVRQCLPYFFSLNKGSQLLKSRRYMNKICD